MAKKKRTVADICDEMLRLDLQIDELNHRKGELTRAYETLAAEAKELMLSEDNPLGPDATVRSKLGTGKLKDREAVAAEDYPALTKWVVKTGNFQIFQNRLSIQAYRELTSDGGRPPPGVKYTKWREFTVTRAKKKA